MKAQQRADVVQAWRIAAFVGISKPPPLEKILARLDRAEAGGRAERMNTEQIETTLDAWVRASSRANRRPGQREPK